MKWNSTFVLNLMTTMTLIMGEIMGVRVELGVCVGFPRRLMDQGAMHGNPATRG
jgi:hypothetical protein